MSELNPLLTPWATPFGMPPFARIRPEHFALAFQHAMETHRAEIAAIGTERARPTFANTIEALQRSGRDLTRIGAVFSNLVASLGGSDYEAVERDISPQLARHGAEVASDPAIFARVDGLHRQRDALSLAEDQRRLLDRTHLGFVRGGAALDEVAKARATAIAERLATLHTAFGQNVVHDERAWLLPLSETDLDGVPDSLRAALAQAASERGLEGHALTLSRSLIEPFLALSPRRDLRQKAHEAWIARGSHPGEHDNRKLIPEILALRRERAMLLGWDDFVAFRLADTMAGKPDVVDELLQSVWAVAKQKALSERDKLTALARSEGCNEKLAPWDWRFYAEKLRRTEFALDDAQVKPFFVLRKLQQAAFDTATRLFGISFRSRPDLPVHHPDVEAYEVVDSSGTVGVFLADPFARPGKRSGAWMSSFRDQETLDGAVLPITVNTNNFAKSDPALLSFDDANTLFHEFGHALHGLLSRVRYPGQSGTSVRRDFVEFPSQIFERWLLLPETLGRYATHHATGQPMTDALMQRLLSVHRQKHGFDTVEYLASAMIDLTLHQHPQPASLDIEAFETNFLSSIDMPPEIGLRHRLVHFQHLFAGGGYAAGYYSYLWSEVLDADGFGTFTDAEGPFDHAAALRLLELLQSGDTRDPMELYIGFRGRPPNPAALLSSFEPPQP